MESLSSDVLGLILEKVYDGEDRKACSEVCAEWYAIESRTRTCVCVLNSADLHHFLPRFPNLTTLVAYVGISDQALRFVADCCPKLRTLDLNMLHRPDFPDEFGDEGLKAVARGCRHLVEILLSSRHVSNDGIVALQTYAKSLEVLDLSYCCEITDRSLAVIGDMESMSELHFLECPLITDEGLSLLSSGPASRSLRVLTICCCGQITDVGILHLKRMSRLEELSLSYCLGITDVGGVALSALSNLKILDLAGLLEISDVTLFAVAKGCRNLVEINLQGCRGITGRGVVSLASSLPLEKIDMTDLLDCRELSSHHVIQIAERCRSLKLLVVDKNLEEGLSPSQREKLSGLVHRWSAYHRWYIRYMRK